MCTLMGVCGTVFQDEVMKRGTILQTNQVLLESTEITDLDYLGVVNNPSNSLQAAVSNPRVPIFKANSMNDLVVSKYYKVGDSIYAMDFRHNAWFEGVIVELIKNPLTYDAVSENDFEDDVPDDDGILYRVKFTNSEELPIALRIKDICPCSRICNLDEINVGDRIMVRYNMIMLPTAGYWYESTVTSVNRPEKYLTADQFMGRNVAPLRGLRITADNSIIKIEKHRKISDTRTQTTATLNGVTPNVTASDNATSVERSSVIVNHRKTPNSIEQDTESNKKFKSVHVAPVGTYCIACNDKLDYDCDWCGCQICSRKTLPKSRLVCSSCNKSFHIWCLNIPSQETLHSGSKWCCSKCKSIENVVCRPETKENIIHINKKPMMSHSYDFKIRDEKRLIAMPCRTKECTSVKSNHLGPIPGIEVGTTWKYRFQVSEAGIHRPMIGGIHGRASEAAYSIVLSGSFPEDEDRGDEFVYTGCGGRLISKKAISFDQTLTRYNKALALNCNAEFDDLIGAESKDWKQGKPVRVVRNYKLRKHSQYAPEEGNRYDGIYKVVKYFPRISSDGFVLWKYLLRRDDPVPAPWTEAGKQRIKELDLKLIQPEEYMFWTKRELKEEAENVLNSMAFLSDLNLYILDEKIEKLIESDERNKELWDGCKKLIPLGKPKFLANVSETFRCICCRELVDSPVTTPCKHNICRECLKTRFSTDICFCPNCNTDLGNSYDIVANVNSCLQNTLESMFPGYNCLRHVEQSPMVNLLISKTDTQLWNDVLADN